jgi:tetratricopeptide (TPR) repeat protein
LFGGGDGDADASQALRAEAAATPDSKKTAEPAPGTTDGIAPADGTATAAKAAEGPDGKSDPAAAEAKSAGEGVSEEGLLYKIDKPIEMESCETATGKSAQDFATTKKWRAIQSWKLSRQRLMAGKEDDALKHMCESAFIDASGPAAAGLVKYYLGKRALAQALAWAERAIEATSGGPSKRAAQQALGDVLNQLGKLDEAKKVWLESFNLTADQTDRLEPVCRNFVGAALRSRKGGDPALAEQMLRRAAAFSPDNAATAALLADILLENEQPQLAQRWAKRALEKDAGSEIAQRVLDRLK